MDVHLKRDLSVAYQVTQISSPSSKGCHCHPLEQTKLRFAMEPPGAALQVSRHHYRLWHDLMPCRAQDPDPTCFPPSETAAAFHPLHTSLQLAERMGFTPTVLGTLGFRSPCNTSLFFHWLCPSSLQAGTQQSSQPCKGQCSQQEQDLLQHQHPAVQSLH